MDAAFWNALSSAYFSDFRGTCNRCWSSHLNCLDTIFWDMNWIIYNGTMLWRALYIKQESLNSICSCMCNQWSWQKTGVICQYRLVLVIILATVLCVIWMCWSWSCAILYKMEFPTSSREHANAWAAVFVASISRKSLIVLMLLPATSTHSYQGNIDFVKRKGIVWHHQCKYVIHIKSNVFTHSNKSINFELLCCIYSDCMGDTA